MIRSIIFIVITSIMLVIKIILIILLKNIYDCPLRGATIYFFHANHIYFLAELLI